MKLVIFAGGYGTRLAELTSELPKPLVTVGDRPIIWHIMKYYSTFGINDFIILGGYKVQKIADFFQNFTSELFDIEICTVSRETTYHSKNTDEWTIRIIDTGLDTLTGSRLNKAKHALVDEEEFFLTYGDGLSDVDLNALRSCHQANNNRVTLTSVTPPARYGMLQNNSRNQQVISFNEKPTKNSDKINGGFFVVSQEIFDEQYNEKNTVWERDILTRLSKKNQLGYYQHNGFWYSMDTLREKEHLEKLWRSDNCPWKVWET